ncbi:D-isomer specific 2-hydroxyacid dehydrogenase-protein [Angomonas deanei]|uniref:D-isomer specific 2-hydroxyacid dehydrogenase, NAD binding domain containing protein, putative n=1 Tax=Angomonas deanei TaxID=59799 RepID=A0A7G2CHM0_9TRYP|nr:D-isomer specific 2-hydroxyacid dehydrogenase-protein [Angomonas deanei]CAD2218845.1 D-isomer specific 2-hydroxyacid dehydrogenase, NAD binding domain containing protein, putative [Angomonas deanei]|eukprot:EPY30505.1 D-isomer specific 2-hydroxyacid dehydrogenase-protein [Angomonas deanei]
MVQGEFGHDVIRYLCDDYDAVPASARRVLWIHSLPVGLDVYQFPLLLNEVQDTLITNGRGSQSMPPAEYVFYSFFYFNRQTTRQLRQKAEREWSPYNIQPLQGSTLCIFGYGDIGQCVARLALAFGMKVIALRRRKNKENENENNHNEVQMVSPQSTEELHTVLGSADYIVNILPHTAETDRYFDKEKFSAMKSSALYVNIGRGKTQVEDDLCECLREGKLRGASLDVYEEEPLPSASPLWSLPDDLILLNPHAAAWHEKQLYNLCQRFVFLCEEWKRGAAMEGHSVNRELWY